MRNASSHAPLHALSCVACQTKSEGPQCRVKAAWDNLPNESEAVDLLRIFDAATKFCFLVDFAIRATVTLDGETSSPF
mgnify:FL=1